MLTRPSTVYQRVGIDMTPRQGQAPRSCDPLEYVRAKNIDAVYQSGFEKAWRRTTDKTQCKSG